MHEHGVRFDWQYIIEETDRDDVRRYAQEQLYGLDEEDDTFRDFVRTRVRATMAKIDEIKQVIPNGAYFDIATLLKEMYEECSP